MPTVVGVQFRPVTKIYHFSPADHLDLLVNDHVIVDTARGLAAAQVVQPPHDIGEDDVTGEIKPVVRRADCLGPGPERSLGTEGTGGAGHLPR